MIYEATHAQVAARYGVVKVADFGLSRVTTLLRTGLGHTSFAGSRSLQQSFNDVRPMHSQGAAPDFEESSPNSTCHRAGHTLAQDLS